MPLSKPGGVPSAGLATMLQALPFQCSASGRVGACRTLALLVPTAQTSVGELAATLAMLTKAVLMPGAKTTLHWTPFQCSNAIGSLVPTVVVAHISVLLITAREVTAPTECSTPFTVAVPGLRKIRHARPFQCSDRPSVPPLVASTCLPAD